MGLITFIRRNLPEPVEKACLEMRMKEQVVQRIYGAVPQQFKNKYHYKEGLSRIKLIFHSITERGTAIYHLIDMTNVEDLTKWKELDNRIKNYKEYAR